MPTFAGGLSGMGQVLYCWYRRLSSVWKSHHTPIRIRRVDQSLPVHVTSTLPMLTCLQADFRCMEQFLCYLHSFLPQDGSQLHISVALQDRPGHSVPCHQHFQNVLSKGGLSVRRKACCWHGSYLGMKIFITFLFAVKISESIQFHSSSSIFRPHFRRLTVSEHLQFSFLSSVMVRCPFLTGS